MKTRRWLVVLFACLVPLSLSFAAQSEKSGGKKSSAEKAPADLAREEFYKARADAAAKPDQATFPKVIASGMNYLVQYPTNNRASEVAHDLVWFGSLLREKNQPLRAPYIAQLKYEIVNQRLKEGVTEETRTALAALEAWAADFDVRDSFNRAALRELREKIDALAQRPDVTALLGPLERDYADVLTRGVSPAAGEAWLRKLTEHQDEAIAKMARADLNLVEVKKQPYDLKFTSIDGKACDFAQLRGKVVALVFWSVANDTSRKELDSMREFYSDNRKAGFEVVTVSYDKPEDREKLLKHVTDTKLPWPVYFDGTGNENSFGTKLNVQRVPTIALFDQKGILVATGFRANTAQPAVRKLLGIKDEPEERQERPAKRRK
jgi:peroxiredoxin